MSYPLNNREKLWCAAFAIVDGLRPKFGGWANTALGIIYDNIMRKSTLSDEEINKVIEELKKIINA